MRHSCRVQVYEDESGGYVAFAPNLPPAIGQGETIKEAIWSIEESILGLAQVYADEGKPMPFDESRDCSKLATGELVLEGDISF